MTVTEYERKFVRLILVERACKAEELGKEKRKADYEARDSRKRSFSKSFQSASRKSREDHSRSKATAGFLKHDRDRPLVSSRATSVTSVGSVRQNRSECKHCRKWHPGDCRLHDRSCFKCGSKDHFIRECPMVADQNTVQNTRPSNVSVRGRLGNVSGSQRGTKDTTVRSKAHAPARAYAIRAREEASSPDFDIILGMDWLTLHDAVVNCKRKTIDLRCLNDEIIRIESNDLNGLSAVISSMLAQKYVRKELPGLPPIREVEFGIELVPGMTPISIASYRMAPTELKELKAQL
ncbi:uncharacterized protein LOC105781927 [Gossypium raimondii]|uniref:uncharacterized protein LOC105781927 n=1 Tax=Gossypium raimondii TaxID=29730 RepID=UPI00227C9BE4|nr:uncharacterized protein LOC105781927 [Gossypium raimondii]